MTDYLAKHLPAPRDPEVAEAVNEAERILKRLEDENNMSSKDKLLNKTLKALTERSEQEHRTALTNERQREKDACLGQYKFDEPFDGAFEIFRLALEKLSSIGAGVCDYEFSHESVDGSTYGKFIVWTGGLTSEDRSKIPDSMDDSRWENLKAYFMTDKRIQMVTVKADGRVITNIPGPVFVITVVYRNPVVWEWL